MGWASAYIARLRGGETVSFRPRGHSMKGRIESGQLCTVAPVEADSLQVGDIVLAIKGNKVTSLPGLFRNIWSVGPAGADIPMMIFRDGSTFELGVTSADRNSFLKGPVLH